MKAILIILAFGTTLYASKCDDAISKVYSLLELKQSTVSNLSGASFGYAAIDNALFTAKLRCTKISEEERVTNLEGSIRAMKAYED